MVQSGINHNPIVTTVKGRKRNWFVIWTGISETKHLSKKEQKNQQWTHSTTLSEYPLIERLLLLEKDRREREGEGRTRVEGSKLLNNWPSIMFCAGHKNPGRGHFYLQWTLPNQDLHKGNLSNSGTYSSSF